MTFDFTNYTFSFLVSILAAILGIGYPLFLECIRKIDEQYHSTRLSRKFQGESIFFWYRFILLISIAISFIAPFAMKLCRAEYFCLIVIAVQATVVFALVIIMLKLFKTVQDYYDPGALVGIIQNKIPPRKGGDTHKRSELLCLSDLIRYTAENRNQDVYNTCKIILERIAKDESKKKGGNEENLSSELTTVLLQLAEYSCDKKNYYLYNDNVAVQIIYDYFKPTHPGEHNYNLLWQSLYKIVDTENFEWFRQYWSYATQYYTFKLKNEPNHELRDAIIYPFKEFQWMVAGMLIYHKKYTWLNFALFYTHVSPPKYDLVPSTLTGILTAAENIYIQKDKPWCLTQKYQMSGMFNDINSDYKLYNVAFQYFALLVIRLHSVNDYNITYSEPFELPIIDGVWTIWQLKQKLEIVNYLIDAIDEWYSDNVIMQINLPIVPAIQKALAPLEEYKFKIETRIVQRQQNPQLYVEKFETLKSLLVEADNNCNYEIGTPTEDDLKKDPTNIIMLSCKYKLDADSCSTDSDSSWSNFPEVFISNLKHKIQSYYDGQFFHIPAAKTFTISKANVFKVLSMLQIPTDYTILSMGVYLNMIDDVHTEKPMLRYDDGHVYFGKHEIIMKNSPQNSILVVKTDDLPRIIATTPSEKMKTESLIELDGSSKHLCSNINKIIEDGTPSPVLSIAKNISVYMNLEMKYIRIRVYEDFDDRVDMDNIDTVENILSH